MSSLLLCSLALTVNSGIIPGPNTIAKNMLYKGYASGLSSSDLRDWNPPKQTLDDCKTVRRIPEWSEKLSNQCGVYALKGDPALRPVVSFQGNFPGKAVHGINNIRRRYSSLYRKGKMPTIYAMNYGGASKASEAIIKGNGAKLLELVYEKHKQSPHVHGSSMGCAVAIGAITEVYEKVAPIPSLTIVDPWSNLPDASSHLFKMGWVFKDRLKKKGTNTWYSDQQISGRAFRKIPIIVFSSTNKDDIPPEHHNIIYGKACGKTAPPVAKDDDLKVTEGKNALGTPRMLAEVKTNGEYTVAPRAMFHEIELDCAFTTEQKQLVDKVKAFFRKHAINSKTYNRKSAKEPVIQRAPSRSGPVPNGMSPRYDVQQPVVGPQNTNPAVPVWKIAALFALSIFVMLVGWIAIFCYCMSRRDTQPRDTLAELEEGYRADFSRANRSRKKRRRHDRL